MHPSPPHSLSLSLYLPDSRVTQTRVSHVSAGGGIHTTAPDCGLLHASPTLASSTSRRSRVVTHRIVPLAEGATSPDPEGAATASDPEGATTSSDPEGAATSDPEGAAKRAILDNILAELAEVNNLIKHSQQKVVPNSNPNPKPNNPDPKGP